VKRRKLAVASPPPVSALVLDFTELNRAFYIYAHALHLERIRDVVPSYTRLKRAARVQAAALGHELGRFWMEHNYAMTRCVRCETAAAVVSPTRYGLRYGGGQALVTLCPVGTPGEAVFPEDEQFDDEAEACNSAPPSDIETAIPGVAGGTGT
jgi:hypothetical protein